MSRRTPVKELITEEIGAPSSPMRRSSRIARRSSVTEDNSKKSMNGDHDDSDRVSVSSASSVGSKKTTKEEKLQSETEKGHERRTPKRRGSTSSLVDEELSSINMEAATPARITRRSVARAMSASPLSESTNQVRIARTPKKSLLVGNVSKKGRSSSLSDGIVLLESIEEIISPKKDLSKNESDTPEKDLPIKKKKTALLQTITEKSFMEDLDHSKDESSNLPDPINKEPSSLGSDTANITKYELTAKAKVSLNSSTEEKELIVLLNSVDASTTKDSSDQPETTDVGNKDSLNTPRAEESISEKATALKNTLNSSDIENFDVVKNKPDVNNASEVIIENKNSSNISEVKETKILGNQDKKEMLNNIDPATPPNSFNLLKTKKDVENEGILPETKKNNISKSETVSSENEKIHESETGDAFNLSESNEAKNDLLITSANEKNKVAKSLNNTVTLKEEDVSLCISGEVDESNHNKSAVDDTSNTLNTKTNKPSQSENDLNTNLNQSSNKEDTFCEPMDVDTTIDDARALSNVEPLEDNADTFSANSDISAPLVTIVSESVDEKILSKDGKQSEIDSTQLNSTIENTELNEKLNVPFDSDLSIVQQSPSQSNIDSDMSKECDNTSKVVSNSTELINSLQNQNKEETMSSEIITSTDAHEASTTPSVKKTIDGLENLSNPEESSVSPDQSDKASQNKNEIIVATEVTPLRRSPRNLGSPGKKIPIVSKKVLEDVSLPVVSPKSGLNHSDESKNTSMEKSPDTKGDIDEEKSTSDLNINCETDHNTSLEKKLIALTATLDVDSSSDEYASNFIDAIAEEGEEDTPSENSNDIIDLGESINSTESELDSNESYELDSFLTDDDDVQLLSGEEYDLGQDKNHKRQKKRIISPSESSGDDEIKPQPKTSEENSKVQKKITAKGEEDSDVDGMSTRPYCGLTPPSVVSVRDSPTEEELKTFNKGEEEIMVNSVLINVEDNLESLEHIKEHSKSPNQVHEPVESPKKSTPKKLSTDSFKDEKKSVTPNNSIGEINTSQLECKNSSSLTIQETLSAADIKNGRVSDHIYRVVEAFCANVSKSGNISLNVSLDYSPSSDESPIHKEHNKVIESIPTSKTEVSSEPFVEAIPTAKDEVVPKRKKKSKKHTSFDESSVVIEEQPMRKTKKLKRKSEQNVKDNIESLKTESKEKINTSDTNLLSKRMKRSKKIAKEKVTGVISTVDMFDNLDKEVYEKYYSDSSRDAADVDTNLGTLVSEELNFKKPKIEKTKRTRKHEGVEDQTIIKKKKRLADVNVDVLATARDDIKQDTSKWKHAALTDDNVSEKKTRSKSGIKTKASKVKGQAEAIYDEVSNKKIKFTSSDGNWEIQYLPDDVKAALNRAIYVREFKAEERKDEKFSKPHRKPKLLPSVDGGRHLWSTNKSTVSLKPSTNIDTVKKTKGATFHSKDFKNQILFDSTRINRMETKDLLKKKNKTKS